MKKLIILSVLALVALTPVTAQTVRSQSMNGSTGLFAIPTGRIGWETGGNFAMDFGHRVIFNNNKIAHIPAITMSIVKWVELSTAFDIQPDTNFMKDNDDLLFGVKIKLPSAKTTGIVIGTNIQLLNFNNENDYAKYNAFQPYVAITYSGIFFTMPAETTMVFGKTIYDGADINNNSNIDFGMGFDLILFPDVFGNAVHWIIDFANFSYSDNAWPNNNQYRHGGPAWYRGALNTGFRVDLSTVPAFKKFKFCLDFIFNDLFDDGQRSFTTGAVFGFSTP